VESKQEDSCSEHVYKCVELIRRLGEIPVKLAMNLIYLGLSKESLNYIKSKGPKSVEDVMEISEGIEESKQEVRELVDPQMNVMRTPGHIAKECWKLHPNLRPKRKWKRQANALIEEEEEENQLNSLCFELDDNKANFKYDVKFIIARVNNMDLKCLIDSGANLSAIKESVFKIS